MLLSLMITLLLGRPPQAPPKAPQKVAPEVSAKVPKLVMSSVEADLGEVKRSAGARHTFNFRNEGDSDLVIRKVAPS